MASSSAARARRLLALLVTVLLLLSSFSALAATEPPRASARPHTIATRRTRHGIHVATAPLPGASVSKNGAGRRTISGRVRRRAYRGRGGGTGAWPFSAMLPRGFVPPSGSSSCHNDMPAAIAYAQFYTCGGSGSP